MKNIARRTLGFTLIELMIVMSVIAILATIAYPSYVAWVRKANRSDAMSTLSWDQTIIERCYAVTFAYNGACASLPAFPQTSPQSHYTITLSNLTATTYTFTATAIGPQALDTTCASMTVDQTNQQMARNNAGVMQTSCWNP